MSTLPVPLTVRIGTKHITSEVSGLAFRKEAVGGVRSISLRLARPLDRLDPDLAAYSRVYLYDARSAAVVAEGRLSDLGRGAEASSGQVWDCVAFGPAQHASDRTIPYILLDTRLDTFTRAYFSTKNAETTTDERSEDLPSLLVSAGDGKPVSTSWEGVWCSRALRRAGMKIGRVSVTFDSGVTDANYIMRLRTSTGDGTRVAVASASSSTTAVVVSGATPTIVDGNDVVYLSADRITSSTTGTENHWFEFWNVAIRAMLKNADGTDIATGYLGNTNRAHQVVNDLLGRVLDQYDGAGAVVDSSGAYAIDQMAYPDGVTAEQVLEDLMALEPAFRWYAGPSNATGKYSFAWEAWPTTVRYEATLDDGGSFPVSAQELYNRVTVRYLDSRGNTRTLTKTGACPILDAAGVVRSTIIDASDETGSPAAADRLADNFLAEHKVPKNSGTLTIARRIRDLKTGAMVEPFEIEPGELIRVRGIEGYTDALNASSSDGQTVFRIWSMEYSSDNHAATLELDADARTVSAALAKLARRRDRKR